jgi:hypothetical protein
MQFYFYFKKKVEQKMAKIVLKGFNFACSTRFHDHRFQEN